MGKPTRQPITLAGGAPRAMARTTAAAPRTSLLQLLVGQIRALLWTAERLAEDPQAEETAGLEAAGQGSPEEFWDSPEPPPAPSPAPHRRAGCQPVPASGSLTGPSAPGPPEESSTHWQLIPSWETTQRGRQWARMIKEVLEHYWQREARRRQTSHQMWSRFVARARERHRWSMRGLALRFSKNMPKKLDHKAPQGLTMRGQRWGWREVASHW